MFASGIMKLSGDRQLRAQLRCNAEGKFSSLSRRQLLPSWPHWPMGFCIENHSASVDTFPAAERCVSSSAAQRRMCKWVNIQPVATFIDPRSQSEHRSTSHFGIFRTSRAHLRPMKFNLNSVNHRHSIKFTLQA